MHMTDVRPDPLPLGSIMPLGGEKRWATKDPDVDTPIKAAPDKKKAAKKPYKSASKKKK